MVELRSLGVATGCAVQITALFVGELSLARLEPHMVVSTDQTVSDRLAPFSFAARLSKRVTDRRQLIGDRARGGFIELGAREIELRDLEELRSDLAARRHRATAAPATGGAE